MNQLRSRGQGTNAYVVERDDAGRWFGTFGWYQSGEGEVFHYCRGEAVPEGFGGL